ncbi:MAG: sulfotransferase [Pseudomonadota bacterium]
MSDILVPRQAIDGPTFIGIGVQKCATSWLHEVLQAHPDVFTSTPKEIDFFSAAFDRGYEWYERHFEEGRAVTARGETSPSYFHHPQVPARIKAYAPDAKLIVVFRDPVDRAFSNHLHELRKWHFTSSERFEDGLRNNPLYLEQSRYAKHMALWLEVFPKEQILPLIFEEITQTPDQAIRQVYAFLGVDPEGKIDESRTSSNESVAFRNDRLQVMLQSGGNALRRAGLGKALESFKSIGPVHYLMNLNKRDLRVEAPPLSDETRALVAAELEDDVKALAKMLGRESFPWRSFPSLRKAA